jgi:YfiH family protein
MGEPFLRHSLLESCGVFHGFGTRGCREPAGLVRPRQVHGAHVMRLFGRRKSSPKSADAIVSDVPGVPVGVVTADCVPILMATPNGRRVAAVHAGWRGLARGVITAAVETFCDTQHDTTRAVAVLGPHISACCYEVDEAVVEALAPRFGDLLDGALAETRERHWRLELGTLTRFELARAGFLLERVALTAGACTACDPHRFHSYRRDGPRAGRLIHFVAAREQT